MQSSETGQSLRRVLGTDLSVDLFAGLHVLGLWATAVPPPQMRKFGAPVHICKGSRSGTKKNSTDKRHSLASLAVACEMYVLCRVLKASRSNVRKRARPSSTTKIGPTSQNPRTFAEEGPLLRGSGYSRPSYLKTRVDEATIIAGLINNSKCLTRNPHKNGSTPCLHPGEPYTPIQSEAAAAAAIRLWQ